MPAHHLTVVFNYSLVPTMPKVLELLVLWLAVNLLAGLFAGFVVLPFKEVSGIAEHSLFLTKVFLGGMLFYYVSLSEGAVAVVGMFRGLLKNRGRAFYVALKYLFLYVLVLCSVVAVLIGGLYSLSMLFGGSLGEYAGVIPPSKDFARINALRGAVSGGVVLYALGTCILVPVIEEVFYRRLLFVELRKQFGFLVSMSITALVFGVFHANILIAVVDGAYLSYVYEKERSLPVNAILHALLNALSVLLILGLRYFTP